jgi:hypothetical protein
MKKFLLILALCGTTMALAGDQLKKFEIKYAIKTSPTHIIIVESTDSYQAQQTFKDMLPEARFITIREVK